MRIADACLSDEEPVEYTTTVFGHKIKACVKKDKQLFIVKNVTYFRGQHCIVQPYADNPSSELEIFEKYNQFGKGEKDTTFIQHPDDNGDMRIGFGTGALLGGIDKDLTFKSVDGETLEKVVDLQKEYKNIESIKDKHNFLFGDGDREKMDEAHKMENEVKRRITDITEWYC